MTDTPNPPTPKRGKRGPARRTDWQQPFLENFAQHGVAAWAAHTVGVSPSTVTTEKGRDPEFRTLFEDAFERSTAALERTAVQWASAGIKTVIRVTKESTGPEGRRTVTTTTTERTELYPPMLMFLLKSRRPTVYRDNIRVEQTGADGGPVRIENVDAIDARIAELMAEMDAAAAEPA